jgi:uncharacterized glyoxalase superfamily protein PhnB
MTDTTHLPSIYPVLRYRDPGAAIEFLTRAFGFGEHQVDKAPDGTIVHAELAWGNGLIMLGSASSSVRTGEGPVDAAYLAVDDPDAHHDRAKAAGAEITMELTDQPYGSREYAARDPEGNTWYFGTYRPAPRPGAAGASR